MVRVALQAEDDAVGQQPVAVPGVLRARPLEPARPAGGEPKSLPLPLRGWWAAATGVPSHRTRPTEEGKAGSMQNPFHINFDVNKVSRGTGL